MGVSDVTVWGVSVCDCVGCQCVTVWGVSV